MVGRAVLMALLIAVLLAGTPAHDCVTWARMVERIEQMAPAEVRKQRGVWLQAAAANRVTSMYVQSAINWLDAGLTSQQAWAECGSV